MELVFSHWAFWAFVTAALVISVSTLVIFIIHRRTPSVSLKESHDVVGFAYGVIGVVYAVLLGFSVVNVQERYNEADHIAQTEATTVADLYRDAHVLGAPYTEEIQNKLKEYVQLVLKDEWPSMVKGKPKASDRVIKNIHDLWFIYYKIEPKTESQKIWLSESIRKLNFFMEVRLQRIYNANEMMNPIMWVLLYAGAAITIGFLGFFWIENFKVHIFITIALASLIAFILFLIQALDSVYEGSIGLRPLALERLAEFLEKWY